jgi:prevent-host-death family protein
MVMSKNAVRRWQVAEAKAGFSKLIAAAAREPQTIERRGTPVAVVVGAEDFRATAAALEAASAEERMRRFLATSAAIRSAGGVTLRIGKRTTRPSPFEDR